MQSRFRKGGTLERQRGLGSLLWRLLQLILIPVLFYTLYDQIWPRLDWGLWQQTLTKAWQSGAWVYLLVVVLLMPVNWLLETQKWRLLLRPRIRLPFRAAWRAVLRGVTISLFTPNRTGEYGGRILSAEKGQHWGFVRATLLGSLAQWSVLLFGGWPAVLWLGQAFVSWSVAVILLALVGGWLVAGLILGLYFWPDQCLQYLPGLEKGKALLLRWRMLRQWLKLSEDKRARRTQTGLSRLKIQALLLAALRFMLYSVQYLLLLYFFAYEVDPLLGLAGIGAIFLIQAGIPLPPGLGLLVRTELALLIWPMADPASAVAATLALFIINLALPALLGMVFIVRMKDVNSIHHAQPQTT